MKRAAPRPNAWSVVASQFCLLASLFLPTGSAVAQNASVTFNPAVPAACQSFLVSTYIPLSEGCGWRTASQVMVAADAIDVHVQVSSDSVICSQVSTSRTVETTLPALPAGVYALRVWVAVQRPSGDKTDLVFSGSLTLEDEPKGAVCLLPTLQIPGDCNQDASIDLSDATCLLEVLFTGARPAFPCGDGSSEDSANLTLLDWQSDGSIDLSDAVSLLRFLFGGGPPHALGIPGRETTACVQISGCGQSVPCSVDPPELVWLARFECRQCEPCEPGSVGEIVDELERLGIRVFDSGRDQGEGIFVCLACSICPSGPRTLVLVSAADAGLLEGEGWSRRV